jgi:hypothetical protein
MYKILPGSPERRRPLGRPRSRWEATLKCALNKCDEVF